MDNSWYNQQIDFIRRGILLILVPPITLFAVLACIDRLALGLYWTAIPFGIIVLLGMAWMIGRTER